MNKELKRVIVTPKYNVTLDDGTIHLVGRNYIVTEFFLMLFEDAYTKVKDAPPNETWYDG